MSTSVRGAVLCVLLCVWYGGVCPVLAEHRCAFPKIAAKQGDLPIAVVQELPKGGQTTSQTYTAASPEWKPIRFTAFADDINYNSRYCTKEGDPRPDFMGSLYKCRAPEILTEAKRNTILTVLLPHAVKLHMDRLRVNPLNTNVVVPKFTDRHCRHFSVNPVHRTKGVPKADMVLYVAAGPSRQIKHSWAAPCLVLPNGRPVVGVLNFAPHTITDTREMIRSIAHEIAHALGFHHLTMRRMKMVSKVLGVRQKKDYVYMVSSNATRREARKHYDCDLIRGMELEDEGSDALAPSHWERRNAKDELMSPIVGAGFYTALTLAAFEDMGFFRANWAMAEPMSWGYEAGCWLLKRRCLYGAQTQYPDMFCNKENVLPVCTSDRRALGYCPIIQYDKPLPLSYRYFRNATIGGPQGNLADFCPFYEPRSNTNCVTGDPAAMPGSRVGPKSMCMKTTGLQMEGKAIGDICAEVACTSKGVLVRFVNAKSWYPCPEGSFVELMYPFSAGTVWCPRRRDVCTDLVVSENVKKEEERLRREASRA
ncbi:surface protease GP63 [Trypanosoma grayi]|uniref:surface protease GP63 n=1 Tax=Trypanosoma grayi TaxID=71804 RepID=UPI0004F3FE11|nr:surface protease GP63 [Trypanosoma grayi]KEG08386.1 surface protease GP63 [Trypanosoma grayi]